MAKRHSHRSRKRQAQQKRKHLIWGAAGLVLVGAIALIALAAGTGSSAPPVPQDRLELDPIKGNPDAPVTLIEYGAYGCSACRAWHQAGVVEQILDRYPDQVRFIFRDYPVIYPAYDRMAAEVAHCALDQSEQGFWRLHDALYTTLAPGSSQAEIIRTGEQLGLDGGELRTCVEQGTHRATVQYHEDRARRLGLPGTPSFMINDARVFNASPQLLAAEIERALAELP